MNLKVDGNRAQTHSKLPARAFSLMGMTAAPGTTPSPSLSSLNAIAEAIVNSNSRYQKVAAIAHPPNKEVFDLGGTLVWQDIQFN